MIAAFVIICLTYFVLRGIAEGIVMVRPYDAMYEIGGEVGPRSHVWFGAYHWLTLTRDTTLILAVWWAVRFGVVAAIPGVLLLGWGLMEIMYSVSRYAMLWPSQENVLGLGYTIRGTPLACLHFIRIIGGMLLLIFA